MSDNKKAMLGSFQNGHTQAGLDMVNFIEEFYEKIPTEFIDRIENYFSNFDYEAFFWIDQE